MKNLKLIALVLFVAILSSCGSLKSTQKQSEKLSALIVTGQNNHAWENSTPMFKQMLEDAIFTVDVATSPKKDGDMSTFNPVFSNYDVVVMDYTGDSWNENTKRSFEEYVSNGGGVVIIHAADNAFPKWEEFNTMIGLGGWGGRNENSGPYVYWKDGKAFRDYSPGSGGSHGKQVEYLVNTRAPKHPIMKGIPQSWLHAQDELYCSMRGPAVNMEILATSFSDKKDNGSGKEEPVLFTIKYGKGRIFHTVLGHVGGNQWIAAQCAGFVATLQRGSEWAATGKVKQALPEVFPTTEKSIRLSYSPKK